MTVQARKDPLGIDGLRRVREQHPQDARADDAGLDLSRRKAPVALGDRAEQGVRLCYLDVGPLEPLGSDELVHDQQARRCQKLFDLTHHVRHRSKVVQ